MWIDNELINFVIECFQSLKEWSNSINAEKEELDEKHKNVSDDNSMLLAKVQELQNSIPELEVKCDNLAEKESQLRELIEQLESDKGNLVTKQVELTAERDNLLTRCEEFTQTIYEYDVQKITMAGKMEELQNKLEVNLSVRCFEFVYVSLASISLADSWIELVKPLHVNERWSQRFISKRPWPSFSSIKHSSITNCY